MRSAVHIANLTMVTIIGFVPNAIELTSRKQYVSILRFMWDVWPKICDFRGMWRDFLGREGIREAQNLPSCVPFFWPFAMPRIVSFLRLVCRRCGFRSWHGPSLVKIWLRGNFGRRKGLKSILRTQSWEEDVVRGFNSKTKCKGVVVCGNRIAVERKNAYSKTFFRVFFVREDLQRGAGSSYSLAILPGQQRINVFRDHARRAFFVSLIHQIGRLNTRNTSRNSSGG